MGKCRALLGLCFNVLSESFRPSVSAPDVLCELKISARWSSQEFSRYCRILLVMRSEPGDVCAQSLSRAARTSFGFVAASRVELREPCGAWIMTDRRIWGYDVLLRLWIVSSWDRLRWWNSCVKRGFWQMRDFVGSSRRRCVSECTTGLSPFDEICREVSRFAATFFLHHPRSSRREYCVNKKRLR